MSKYWDLTIALLTGMLLGTIFFSGLWWTIRKITTSKFPGILFLSSLIIRIAIITLGFFLVTKLHSENSWMLVVICLLGFLLARFVITKMIRAQTKLNLEKKGPYHAS